MISIPTGLKVYMENVKPQTLWKKNQKKLKNVITHFNARTALERHRRGIRISDFIRLTGED